MSNNLGFDQVTENQANKEVTINTMSGQVDAAMTEALAVDVASGNATVTTSQARRNVLLNVINASVGGRTVTLPAIKRLIHVSSAAANTQSVSIVRGSASIALAPGTHNIFYTDGTTNGLVALLSAAGATTNPYDLATFCGGLPGVSEKLLRYAFVRNVDLPASLTGSVVKAAVAATAQTDFDLQKNGASIGTIRFAAAGTTATFVGISAASFASGDILGIIAPSTQDTTLADISFSFAGVRV